MELGENELAIKNFSILQKSFFWTQDINKITRNIFKSLPKEDQWFFFKNVVKSDLLNPKCFFMFFLIYFCLLFPFFLLNIKMELPGTILLLSVIILTILFIENYINTRTAITLDKITISGSALGLILNLTLSLYGYETISVSMGNALMGFLIGLSFTFSIAWIYQVLTGKEGIGGGTIKLTAMIGSWTGLYIIPIIFISIIIFVSQSILWGFSVKLPGELKWNGNILMPRLINKMKFTIPSSTALFYSTWITLIIFCTNFFG